MSIAPRHDPHKKCFTYCGDDRCNCPARRAWSLLDWTSSALPVLETMARKAGLDMAADKAADMSAEVSAAKATGVHPHE